MSLLLRVILALTVFGAFAGVGVWGIVAVLQAKRLTESQHMIGVGGIVVVMALLAGGDLLLARALGPSYEPALRRTSMDPAEGRGERAVLR